MSKSWGIARFYGMGSMEYLLESGQWLHDGKLYDGAPVRLFTTMAEADDYAQQFQQDSQPHGVQFMLGGSGEVITLKSKEVARAGLKLPSRARSTPTASSLKRR